MCIVTASRGSYSGAKAIAEGVARNLQVDCVSREVMVEAAELAGIPMESFGEVLGRPPSFFERLSWERDTYLSFLRAALYERAAAGSFVYHGHGGHHMLSDLTNVLRLRVLAPLEFRIRAVRDTLDLDERQARRHIAKMDRHRAKWVRYLYDVEWSDPRQYDVVVNLERIDVPGAVQLVTDLACSPRFAWTEALRRKAADRALELKVSAELSRTSAAHGAGLEIEVEGGSVVLRGTTQYAEMRDGIVAVVAGVPGVDEVRSEIALRSDILKD